MKTRRPSVTAVLDAQERVQLARDLLTHMEASDSRFDAAYDEYRAALAARTTIEGARYGKH